MTNIEIVNKSIKIIEKIDSDKIVVGAFNGDECGCVLRHLYRADQSICFEIGDIIFDFLKIGLVDINDGMSRKYRQQTPKERVLAAFNDCLARMGT